MAFSPDGGWVASGGQDGCVKARALWAHETLLSPPPFSAHPLSVKYARLCLLHLALARPEHNSRNHPNNPIRPSARETPQIWDLKAGKLLRELPPHGGAVTALEFHPHEFLLATGSADKTVRFWDLETFDHVADGAGPTRTGLGAARGAARAAWEGEHAGLALHFPMGAQADALASPGVGAQRGLRRPGSVRRCSTRRGRRSSPESRTASRRGPARPADTGWPAQSVPQAGDKRRTPLRSAGVGVGAQDAV